MEPPHTERVLDADIYYYSTDPPTPPNPAPTTISPTRESGTSTSEARDYPQLHALRRLVAVAPNLAATHPARSGAASRQFKPYQAAPTPYFFIAEGTKTGLPCCSLRGWHGTQAKARQRTSHGC